MAISSTTGWGILFCFWLTMMAVSALAGRMSDRGAESFLAADRNVGVARGAFSIAASWIWAPALFISSQKAFEQGLAGMFWFTFPNILTLILFGFLARRIRELMPNGYTLCQYIRHRFDTRTHALYIFMFLSLQVCSVAVQLLAGGAIVADLAGIGPVAATLVMAGIFLSYSLISGLKASIATDFLQMGLILFACLVVVPALVWKAGGLQMVAAGLGGVSGHYRNIFNPEVTLNFGIIVTIGLLAGPIGDQQHWQRAFALSRAGVGRAYLLSGAVFGVVPAMLSALGFVAAGMVIRHGLVVPSPQMVGVQIVSELLPTGFYLFFILMILAGLASTGDSALCAAGGIVAIDIYGTYVRPRKAASDPDGRLVAVSRLTMIGVTAAAILIALIPNMKILYLFLFYGTLRACDMMPTALSLYMERLTARGVFFGILSAAAFGLPLFIHGAASGNPRVTIIAVAGVLILSTAIPLILARRSVFPLKSEPRQ